MKGLAHMVQSPVGIDHNSLRCLKRFPALQLPLESLRIDPRQQPQRIMRIHFRLQSEIAAVDKGNTDDLPLPLVGIRPPQHHKRIMLMGGIAPHTADGSDARLQIAGTDMTFSGPAAGKLLPHILSVRQIQAQTHGPAQAHGLRATVADPHTARQYASSGKDRIVQFHLYPRHPIF